MDPILANRAAFSNTLTFQDLPAVAVTAARDRLLDAIACAIGAHECDTATVGRSLAGAAAHRPWAGRLLGSKKLAAADAAAFVNTCMIRNLDLNDIIQGGHPSDCLAVRNAVFGVQLAAAGMTGPEAPFTGASRPGGFDYGAV